ncbi:hypothetical protein ACU8KH_03064 [Lachancea thermotolerans]
MPLVAPGEKDLSFIKTSRPVLLVSSIADLLSPVAKGFDLVNSPDYAHPSSIGTRLPGPFAWNTTTGSL